MRTVQRDTHARSDWRTLTRTAAGVTVLLLLVTAMLLRDREAAAYAVAAAGALALTWFRTGLLGIVALGVLFANMFLWMAPGAVSNLRHGEGVLDAMLPAALAAVSLTGLAGALGWILRRRRTGPGPERARAVAACGVALFVAAMVLSAVGPGRAGTGVRADLSIESRDAKYSADMLRARAGTISVRMSNHDLFWHTFTVPDLDVNLNVPVRADRTVSFSAPAGRYEFICAIPGHTALGMKGVLVVA